MQDHVSRLVGLDGFRVGRVIEGGNQLDLEVELIARAQSCPHCESEELEVHERPVVAVRDLPLCGRQATLRWRKRRYRCKACRRTHTESCEQGRSRQRLTSRAAICCSRIVHHRPFPEGNMRVGYECMREMLEQSGIPWRRPSEDVEEIASMIEGLAARTISEQEFVTWVKRRTEIQE